MRFSHASVQLQVRKRAQLWLSWVYGLSSVIPLDSIEAIGVKFTWNQAPCKGKWPKVKGSYRLAAELGQYGMSTRNIGLCPYGTPERYL